MYLSKMCFAICVTLSNEPMKGAYSIIGLGLRWIIFQHLWCHLAVNVVYHVELLYSMAKPMVHALDTKDGKSVHFRRRKILLVVRTHPCNRVVCCVGPLGYN